MGIVIAAIAIAAAILMVVGIYFAVLDILKD